MSLQNQWDDNNEAAQPQAVPPMNTVEYWSYVLREQRRESQRRRQEAVGIRLQHRMPLMFRQYPALEQQLQNMRMEE